MSLDRTDMTLLHGVSARELLYVGEGCWSRNDAAVSADDSDRLNMLVARGFVTFPPGAPPCLTGYGREAIR